MNIQYERVLAALDDGLTQRLVLGAAVEHAKNNGASLVLAHVVPCLPSKMSIECIDAICAGTKERLEGELADLLAEIRDSKDIPSWELKVYAGQVTGVLLDEVVKEYDPDLVVCGDRGLSGLKYALLGSVSSALVRNVKCDVLVVKNQNHQ